MSTTKSIYTQNKYNTWYHNIISNAQSQNRVKGNNEYYENHHIIPHSFGGGNGLNLVLLSAREHFICHALLVRFTINSYKVKMIYAFHSMSMSNSEDNLYLNSRLYESNKIEHAKLVSENMKGNTNNLGKRFSKEHKEKMSIARKGKYKGKNNHWYRGDYITPWGIFETTREAAKKCPYKIGATSILNWCRKHSDKIIIQKIINHSIYLKSLPESPLGKTFREIGFWFEPI